MAQAQNGSSGMSTATPLLSIAHMTASAKKERNEMLPQISADQLPNCDSPCNQGRLENYQISEF